MKEKRDLLNVFRAVNGEVILIASAKSKETHYQLIKKLDETRKADIDDIYAYTGCNYDIAIQLYEEISDTPAFDNFMKAVRNEEITLIHVEEIYIRMATANTGLVFMNALKNIDKSNNKCTLESYTISDYDEHESKKKVYKSYSYNTATKLLQY